jgi:hypothetical protein
VRNFAHVLELFFNAVKPLNQQADLTFNRSNPEEPTGQRADPASSELTRVSSDQDGYRRIKSR